MATLTESASTALGVEELVFLRHAIAKDARRIVDSGSRHVLSKADAELLATALDTPPAPTSRARQAAASYHRRVLHAD